MIISSNEYLITAGSQLLEVSRGARKHASEKFTVVLAELSRGMQTLLDADDLCMVHRQQQLHVLIKVHLSLISFANHHILQNRLF